mmetsp:Transcript_33211/g.93100  ORF Transcript_33211/g.93100 Transcript_33211/m.93100 type:complete len:269 (+) Transcript_33211:2194-3000(+)
MTALHARVVPFSTEPRNVPHAHRIVQRRRYHVVFLWMKLRAHDVMNVSRQCGNTLPGLPVPDKNGLVVGGAQDPGTNFVELDGSNIVKMFGKCKQTLPHLVVPHLNVEVVAPRHEQRLSGVEAHSPHRTFMFVKAVDKKLSAIVPQLNHARVETGEQPRAGRVKRQSFHPGGLGFEFYQHVCFRLTRSNAHLLLSLVHLPSLQQSRSSHSHKCNPPLFSLSLSFSFFFTLSSLLSPSLPLSPFPSLSPSLSISLYLSSSLSLSLVFAV